MTSGFVFIFFVNDIGRGNLMDAELDALIEKRVKEVLDREFEAKWSEYIKQKSDENRVAIIASKGSMDMAYPPLILAAAAAAMDMETSIFFTFYCRALSMFFKWIFK